jgi:hypothetical protein
MAAIEIPRFKIIIPTKCTRNDCSVLYVDFIDAANRDDNDSDTVRYLYYTYAIITTTTKVLFGMKIESQWLTVLLPRYDSPPFEFKLKKSEKQHTPTKYQTLKVLFLWVF